MSHTRSTTRLLSAANATRRGFTLLEILVAVGAVALVSVGIAAIFDSVGKTVNTGRRVSRNQTIAARVETQIRRDFAQISRDGFLLIRQQVASKLAGGNSVFPYASYTPVQLSSRDVDTGKPPRDRRVDEIMFFAKGNFTSAMEPVSADYIARSNEAAIYYGHGQRRSDALSEPGQAGANVRVPRLDDDTSMLAMVQSDAANISLGLKADVVAGSPNPNQYASDWILLRKPILLVQPSVARAVRGQLPADLSSGVIDDRILVDSDVQIELQPAASSIFQRLSRIYPLSQPRNTIGTPRESIALWADNNLNPMPPYTGIFTQAAALRPQISSGLVDIATTDLAEIRTIITTCPARPAQILFAFDPTNPQNDIFQPRDYGKTFPDPSSPGHQAWEFPVGAGFWDVGSDNTWRVTPNLTDTPQGHAILRMHTWMQNALPNRSDGFSQIYDLADQAADLRQPGARVRCASSWTSRDDVIRVTPAAGGPPPNPLATYFRRRNQLALSAHNFIEHCSEFMVEWSFGLTDPATNRIIWYGTPFQDVLSGTDASREMTMYRGGFDPDSPGSLPDPENIPYNPFMGMPGLPTQLTANPAVPVSIDLNARNAYRVSKYLIYGNEGSAFGVGPGFCPPEFTDACLTSHFGYFDPSFKPQAVPVTVAPERPETRSFESLGVSSLPWAWPKMLRITVRIADETDPTLEDSFQFVVDLPPTPHP